MLDTRDTDTTMSSALTQGLLNVPLDKSKSTTRWIILPLACLMLVGSYYCFDIPAALKTQLDDWMGDPSDYEFKFGLLYTLYAAPNVILPFFGGFFVDKLGVRICLMVFACLIALGQIIFSLGVSFRSWPLIFLGRFVFGLGGESFTVANSVLLADWFKGRELAFAFGINLSVAKLGSVLNNILSPALAESAGVLFALWFGSILCGFGILCVVLTWPIDKRFDDMIVAQEKAMAIDGGGGGLESEKDDLRLSALHATAATTATGVDEEESSLRKRVNSSEEWRHSNMTPGSTVGASAAGEQRPGRSVSGASSDSADSKGSNDVSFKEVFSLSHIFWVLVVSCMVVYGSVLPFNNISSSLLLERDYFKEPPSHCQLEIPTECQSSTNVPVNCPSSKWYALPLPSNYTADDVDCNDKKWSGADGCAKAYCDRLADAEAQAGVVMSIPYIISAVLSPPLGYLVDMYGWRAVIAAVAPGILVLVHTMLGYTDVNAVIPLVGQGLAYTGFVSVLWPAVPLVVEDRVSGLAFGIVTSAQNLACALLPLIIAAIYSDSNDKYIPNVELLFALLGGIGFLVGLYMNYYDVRHNSILNRGFAAAEKADADDLLAAAAAADAAGEKEALLRARGLADSDSAAEAQSPMHSPRQKKGVSFDVNTVPDHGPQDIRQQSLDISDDESGIRRRNNSRGSRGSRSNSRSASIDRGHRLSFSSHDEMLRGGAYRHKQDK